MLHIGGTAAFVDVSNRARVQMRFVLGRTNRLLKVRAVVKRRHATLNALPTRFAIVARRRHCGDAKQIAEQRLILGCAARGIAAHRVERQRVGDGVASLLRHTVVRRQWQRRIWRDVRCARTVKRDLQVWRESGAIAHVEVRPKIATMHRHLLVARRTRGCGACADTERRSINHRIAASVRVVERSDVWTERIEQRTVESGDNRCDVRDSRRNGARRMHSGDKRLRSGRDGAVGLLRELTGHAFETRTILGVLGTWHTGARHDRHAAGTAAVLAAVGVGLAHNALDTHRRIADNRRRLVEHRKRSDRPRERDAARRHVHHERGRRDHGARLSRRRNACFFRGGTRLTFIVTAANTWRARCACATTETRGTASAGRISNTLF